MYENLRLRGWLTVIGAGFAIGFFIGLCLIFSIDNPVYAKYGFWISVGLGLLGGIAIGLNMERKGIMDNWHQPINRSADFDNYQDAFVDKNQDNEIINLIPTLTDYELIQLIAFRYPQMLKKTKALMSSELTNRKISKDRFLDTFNTLETFRVKSEAYCPKCGFKKYNPNAERGQVNCVLCGYYHDIENPNLFINKLKRNMGFYYDIGISSMTIENELYK
jgi:rubredoxin